MAQSKRSKNMKQKYKKNEKAVIESIIGYPIVINPDIIVNFSDLDINQPSKSKIKYHKKDHGDFELEYASYPYIQQGTQKEWICSAKFDNEPYLYDCNPNHIMLCYPYYYDAIMGLILFNDHARKFAISYLIWYGDEDDKNKKSVQVCFCFRFFFYFYH